MNSDKKIAIIVGTLFIIGTVAGSLSVILSESILSDSDYLTKIAANETKIVMSAFLELVMAAAVIAIPYVIFPILKKHNERVAIGYIGARTMEGVGYVISVIILLSLKSLSQEFLGVGSSGASNFQALGVMLLAVREWATFIGVYMVFNLGALLFYYLLYKSKLVPNFISIWGFIAALMWFAGVLLVLFNLTTTSSTIYIISYLPMFVQEMVMAVWLIVKGFNSSVITSASEKISL